ncbi:MAG: ABC transporter permease [Clostridiales bacterium]|nr:ABC transporter permease [Clostridiales bacterium]
MKKKGKRGFLRYGSIAPVAIWLLVFLILPYLNLFLYSFWKNGAFDIVREFTLENYIRFFTGGQYTILLDTLKTSLIVTVITVIISFPLAYFINFLVKKTKYKQMVYMLAIIPLWVSYIMRAYAWKTILGTNGVLNSFLMWIGITDQPLEIFLYSNVSVIIAMVHIYTPYVLMPMYTALEQIPRNLIEASKDLGCNGFRTLCKVIIPLSLPGIITGATYSFALSMGDFLPPSLLGGSTTSTKIANIVQMQFGTSDDWPYGAAIGIIILIFVLVMLEVTNRLEKHYSKLEEG